MSASDGSGIVSTHGSHTFDGVLRRTPFPAEVWPAELRPVPLQGDDDFHRMALVEVNSAVPVLVSYPEYYALLEDLVREGTRRVPGVITLIRSRGPYIVRLPNVLLEERVFMFDNPWRLAHSHEGREVLVLDDRIRRHGAERGDNSIRIRLLGSRMAVAEFAAYVAATRLYSAVMP